MNEELNKPAEEKPLLSYSRLDEKPLLHNQAAISAAVEYLNKHNAYYYEGLPEFEADQKAKKSNMEIVCIFHSHPESEAQPSETDKKFMRVNPFPWIIYSGKTKEMNCFILQDENVKQISII